MKLTGPFAGRRNAAVGKAFYVRELRGQMIVQKWPRARGRPLHPTTLEQNEKFKQANKMSQFAPARIQMAHRTMVEGTNLLPRDLMIAAMMGRGLNFVSSSAERRYPVAARQDLSLTLDILGALAGDILARGPEFWERVRPTLPGQVLTSNLAGEPPSFKPVPGGVGVWEPIVDEVVPSDLGLGVLHNVSLPAAWEELQCTIWIPFNSTGVSVLSQFNNDQATNYATTAWESSTTSGFTAQELASTTVLRWVRLAGTANDGPMYLSGNFLRDPTTERVRMLGRRWSDDTGVQSTTSGLWKNPTAAVPSLLGFESLAGVGIRAGTRIVVRAILAP